MQWRCVDRVAQEQKGLAASGAITQTGNDFVTRRWGHKTGE